MPRAVIESSTAAGTQSFETALASKACADIFRIESGQRSRTEPKNNDLVAITGVR